MAHPPPDSVVPEPDWCLVGNIVDWRTHGEARTVHSGTKHFGPGAKVYCLPAQWGDGYTNIVVIGRHRGSKRFVKMVVRAVWVTNWRAKVVYEPAVRRLIYAHSNTWPWKSKTHVDEYLEALRPSERSRPVSIIGRLRLSLARLCQRLARWFRRQAR